MFRALVRRVLSPGTRSRAREAYAAGARLGTHMVREFRHRGALAAHCAGKTGLLLNIGCGKLIRPGWVNIDYIPGKGSFYFDAAGPLPVADGAVRHIHSEHFLEHLEFPDAARLLRECHRVLQPGGSMRIIVPDAELYMRAYCEENSEFFAKLAELGCPSERLTTRIMVCNQSFRMGGDHRFAWDFETLKVIAFRARFKDINRSSFNEVAAEFRIDGEEDSRRLESLYVNLVR